MDLLSGPAGTGKEKLMLTVGASLQRCGDTAQLRTARFLGSERGGSGRIVADSEVVRARLFCILRFPQRHDTKSVDSGKMPDGVVCSGLSGVRSTLSEMGET